MDNLVAQIVAAGAGSAIFTYFSVRLWVKPIFEIEDDSGAAFVPQQNKFKINAYTGLIALIMSLVLTAIIKWGVNFDINVIPLVLQSLLSAIIAAATATYGHEVVKNYGQRNLTVGGDNITVGSIEDSTGVAIGEDSDSQYHGGGG